MQITHVRRVEPARHIAETETELASIASQIAQLGDRAKLLANEAAPSRMKLRVYDAVLSPFRRIPSDILLEIARHAQPQYPQPTRTEAPMSLTHVSSAWRAVILSCPEFWKVLYLQVRKPVPSSQLTRAWFERAKTQPLSLFVHLDFDVEEISAPLVGYLEGLRSHTARLHRLGLGCSQVIDLFPHLQQTKSIYPNLKSLDLICTERGTFSDESDGAPLPKLNIFNESPLETVVIRSDFIARSNFGRILPWAVLTQVSVTTWITAGEVIKILNICPKLKTGDFCVLNNNHNIFSRLPNQAVVHKNVEDLHLNFFIQELCPLELLSLPSLKKLIISRNNEGGDDRFITLRAQDFSYSKNLRSLSFDCLLIKPHNGTDAGVLIGILRQTAVLEELILTRAHIDHYLIPVFTAMIFYGSNKLLPLLTTLRVGLHNDFDASQVTDHDVNPLHHMVESRCLPRQPVTCKSLERICISGSADNSRSKVLEELLRPRIPTDLLLEIGCLHVDPPPRVQPFNGWRPSSKRRR